MKTTQSEVKVAARNYMDCLRYHAALPENVQYKNADNLNFHRAKYESLNEALKLGM
jgi:hypothetical protein